MHDRRIDGQEAIFGNQGALFMNAMTWWDHDTESIWSQVWGQAILGPLEGTRLDLVPASIVPWATWLKEHPDTSVLAIPGDLPFRPVGERPRDDFVIGISLGEDAKAYPYPIASRQRVINDAVGTNPILVYVDPQLRSIQVFLRKVGERTLTFEFRDGELLDRETGSVWNPTLGLATEGKLKGQILLQVPYVSSFDWAWLNFYPDSQFYLGQ